MAGEGSSVLSKPAQRLHCKHKPQAGQPLDVIQPGFIFCC